MSVEPAFVDTNVLVYALFPESSFHKASRALLDQAQDGHVDLCTTIQTLAEFYSVVTNPRRVTLPRRPDEAIQVIEQIMLLPGLTVLPIPPDIAGRWTTLLRKYLVVGSAVFDVQLVASMLSHGITRIYTFDRAHFARFDEIEILTA